MKIREEWAADDSERQGILENARLCASLSKPWVLPLAGQSASQELPQVFSSVVPRGTENIKHQSLTALFPPGIPFIHLNPAAKLRYSRSVDPKRLQFFSSALSIIEMLILAKLESMVLHDGVQARAGFRSRQGQALDQLFITGDTLQQFTDDWRIRVFRRTQYVTSRNPEGDVEYHIIEELVDPVALDPTILEKAKLNLEECKAKGRKERLVKLYTKTEFQPQTKTWRVLQELNGEVVKESDETVSQYFATPYDLAPGENYGRGFIEQNLGDVRTLNSLDERLLDFAAMASKFLTAIDQASMVTINDLAKPSGSAIIARVVGGKVQDVATIQADKFNDFQVVFQTRESKRKDLSAAMLLESELQPHKDRVTAAQIERIAMAVHAATNGALIPIADHMQLPLGERAFYQARRDGLIPTFPRELMEMEAQTGLAAVAREAEASKLLGLLQTVLPVLGEEAIKRIDAGTLFNVLVRYSGVHEPGLVKSEERVAQEMQAALEQQTELAARQEIVKAGGAALAAEAAPQGVAA